MTVDDMARALAQNPVFASVPSTTRRLLVVDYMREQHGQEPRTVTKDGKVVPCTDDCPFIVYPGFSIDATVPQQRRLSGARDADAYSVRRAQVEENVRRARIEQEKERQRKEDELERERRRRNVDAEHATRRNGSPKPFTPPPGVPHAARASKKASKALLSSADVAKRVAAREAHLAALRVVCERKKAEALTNAEREIRRAAALETAHAIVYE